ncbi:hypothetical protein NQ315_010034 [Exocentrus adspersus]|uniref:Sulfotransferase domain-containing protein n=1 Tax=Exocentrus adspersus TaxID=1586481 RepID=A0AAV8VKR5_9CUCU|nr:hypothetical protein NQ315_010034 [Exocentrus adspersus]
MSFTFKPLEGKYADIYEKGIGVKDLMYKVTPGNYVCSFLYKDMVQKVLDFPVRSDDVWMVSFARTGSTWCQEMIWLIGNNLDLDTARNTLQQFRAPLLETSAVLFEFADLLKEKFTDSLEYISSLASPRYIKTHLNYHLLPTGIREVKPKIIYTIRNPKDVCVSFFYHSRLLHNFNVDFESFCELFLNDAVFGGNIIQHYLEFWNRRHDSNILVLRYEEMLSDTRGTVRKIADFMEKPISEDDISAIEDFLTVKNMRKHKGCNGEPFVEMKNGPDYSEKTGLHFIRQGKVGDWKSHMSPEMVKRFDDYIEKYTKGTDLSFD